MSATTGLGGVSTGVGSLPGTDPLAAATWVLDEAPDLPHLAELPERGIGADAVGRSAAMLVDLPVEVVHSGWQVSARPGTDLARARRLLGDDLAALEVAAHGYRGPMKVQVLGPVTLACVLGQARGEAALSDPGLRRELAQSLAEGVRRHLGDLTARVPGAVPVLQVDEPALPAALAGAQPTRSGWGRLAPLDQGWAEQMLGEVLAACPDRESRIVHCCARDVPVALVVSAGAGVLAFDLDLVSDPDIERYAEAVDAGADLVAGAVPTSHTVTSSVVADRVRHLWSRLGFSGESMRPRTAVSPACGLAGVPEEQALAAYRTAGEAALRLSEHDGVYPGR